MTELYKELESILNDEDKKVLITFVNCTNDTAIKTAIHQYRLKYYFQSIVKQIEKDLVELNLIPTDEEVKERMAHENIIRRIIFREETFKVEYSAFTTL